MAAHPKCRGTTVCHCDDGFGPQVVGSEQCTQCNGLVNAVELPPSKADVCRELLRSFRCGADLGHFAHSFQWVLASGSFCTEHHGISTIEDGVGNITDFSTGRYGMGNHALHHLRGGND